MKLNYKRTILVGFAFFLILAFWQAYEAIVPLMLVNKFGLSQTASGVIMALDNVLAIFLLPLFGSLSDKTNSKFGKRTPYIIVGTIVAIAAFIGLTFADNAQLAQLSIMNNPEQFHAQLYEDNTEILNAEKEASYDNSVAEKYSVQDYAAYINYNKPYGELDADQKASLKQWFISLNAETDEQAGAHNLYYYDYGNKIYYTSLEGLDEEAAASAIKYNAYQNLVVVASSNFAWTQTVKNPVPLICFVVILLIVLLAMATFRSPAVALMPDVTIKPLRSQGNAIINLMGTFGGMLVLVLGMVFGTGNVKNQTASFTGYVIAVCVIMAIGLTLFLAFVREKKWAAEMEQTSKELGIDTEADEIEDLVDSDVKESSKGNGTGIKELIKNDKGKFISLILILLSVALWYTGYNAASSKYSLYATNILHKDYNLTLLIAQGAAIVAYLPAGALAAKIGRKKSILAGVALLTCAFFSVAFCTAKTPTIVLKIVFALGGIGWATITVNSFPMVVELAKGNDVGKYTGYYYTASMAAQIITPILSGAIMDLFGGMQPLFFYSTIFIGLSFVTMLFVKHGDNLRLKEEKEQSLAQNEAE